MPKAISRRMVIGALTVSTIILVAFLVLFGYYGVPLPQQDAMDYIPPAINYAAGKGLVNEISVCAYITDPQGGARFLYYPPLFQIVLGQLMPHADAPSAFLAISLIDSFCLILCVWLFYRVLQMRRKNILREDLMLILLAEWGTATIFTHHYGGRPEILGTLFLVLALLSFTYFSINALWLPLSLCLGFMIATHPVGAIGLALCCGMYYALRCEIKEAFTWLSVVYWSAIFIFLMTMLLSKYPLVDLVQGMYRHAQLALGMSSLYSFWVYYIFNPRASFFGLLIAVFLFFLSGVLWRQKARIATPSLFTIFLGLFLATTYYFGFGSYNRFYNAAMLTPLLMAGILYGFTFLRRSVWLTATVVGVLMLSSLGFLRCVLLLPYHVAHGMTLRQARQLFVQIRHQYPPDTVFAVSPSLWTLSEDYSHMYDFEGFESFDRLKGKPVVLLLQQNYRFHDAPPMYYGFVFKKSYFVQDIPHLFSIPLAHKMPGYSFAIYLPPASS